MLIGYMRVSSTDERQSVALQRDALLAAGVDQRHLHQDRASGGRFRLGAESYVSTSWALSHLRIRPRALA